MQSRQFIVCCIYADTGVPKRNLSHIFFPEAVISALGIQVISNFFRNINWRALDILQDVFIDLYLLLIRLL